MGHEILNHPEEVKRNQISEELFNANQRDRMSGLIKGEVVFCHLALSTSNQETLTGGKVRQGHLLIGDFRRGT
ncbi:hypothetical protein AMECASPLE_035144 [Ameca splendens]|uniref:Uncharacterized protein n=1 Tax=Ameca splendens TaxID=208324 RepID=A0ABV0YV11_9TELE